MPKLDYYFLFTILLCYSLGYLSVGKCGDKLFTMDDDASASFFFLKQSINCWLILSVNNVRKKAAEVQRERDNKKGYNRERKNA